MYWPRAGAQLASGSQYRCVSKISHTAAKQISFARHGVSQMPLRDHTPNKGSRSQFELVISSECAPIIGDGSRMAIVPGIGKASA